MQYISIPGSSRVASQASIGIYLPEENAFVSTGMLQEGGRRQVLQWKCMQSGRCVGDPRVQYSSVLPVSSSVVPPGMQAGGSIPEILPGNPE